MLGIFTRFLVVWVDGSEYAKTMNFILLMRWQKPGIVYLSTWLWAQGSILEYSICLMLFCFHFSQRKESQQVLKSSRNL